MRVRVLACAYGHISTTWSAWKEDLSLPTSHGLEVARNLCAVSYHSKHNDVTIGQRESAAATLLDAVHETAKKIKAACIIGGDFNFKLPEANSIDFDSGLEWRIANTMV
eukprot:GHVU01111512.1.p1 GENE.GHVU01111512.1~~GHVU01111512.1.p1  ORF type:complete len:109 (+),score=12.81 GHVU01111512.1:132-458(+)